MQPSRHNSFPSLGIVSKYGTVILAIIDLIGKGIILLAGF